MRRRHARQAAVCHSLGRRPSGGDRRGPLMREMELFGPDLHLTLTSGIWRPAPKPQAGISSETDSSAQPGTSFAELPSRRSQKTPGQQRDGEGRAGECRYRVSPPQQGKRLQRPPMAPLPRLRLRGRRCPGGRSEADGEPAIGVIAHSGEPPPCPDAMLAGTTDANRGGERYAAHHAEFAAAAGIAFEPAAFQGQPHHPRRGSRPGRSAGRAVAHLISLAEYDLRLTELC
jgi:hypothetical protein